ncbi:MAG: EamA family transporter [Gammaproteobacteria bacterium]|nr:EamA family transporter [Gammaproteobacteria bacterium]
MISIAAATALYWAAAPWQLDMDTLIHHYLPSSAIWLFALVGLFRPALSSTFAMAGTAILGPTISTTLSATAPLFGLLFGVMLLGEAFTLPVTLGTVTIVAGVMLLAKRGGHDITGHWPLWALVLPVLAAVIRVCAHLVTKVGMEEIASPYFAGLVAYNVSLLVAAANLARRRVNPITLLAANSASWWFALTGILFGIAIFTVNTALQYGPLSVVAPLVSLEAIFVLFLGVTVFRERKIDARVTLAVLLVVVGAVAISARD